MVAPINVNSNEENLRYQSKGLNTTRSENVTPSTSTTNKSTTSTSQSGGIQATAAVTLGAAVGIELKIADSPISFGVMMNTGSVDAVGLRNNTFTVFGHEFNGDRTGVLRKEASVNVLGFGSSSTVETSYPKSGGNKNIEVTEAQSATFFTEETTKLNNGSTQTQSTITLFSLKGAAFVGVDIEVKMPIGSPGFATPLLPKNGPIDNTFVNKQFSLINKK